MNITLAFIRIFFFLMSIFFLTTYMVSGPGGHSSHNFGLGVLYGTCLGVFLLGVDYLFRRFNLRSFNIALLGLFFGYFLGVALLFILKMILDISSASILLDTRVLEITKISLFLFSLYLGTLMTLRSSDELYISIPFVKFTPTTHKKRDLVIDPSVLADARILDLSASGLVDKHLVIPRFILKDLYAQIELPDEMIREKAKRALDVVKKMEAMAELELRINDTDFPDIKEPVAKIIRFARLLDASILTADITKIQMASIEGVRFINLHALSAALKPIMQTGDKLKIKIQHAGKGAGQGVGYLEDGTMVVVNGAEGHLQKTVSANVLSVKHTSAGRLIFCNIEENQNHHHHYEQGDE